MTHLTQFLIWALFLKASFAHAEKITFDQLCSYESDCIHLKHPNGKFKEPKLELIQLLKDLNPYIKETAERYKIKPEALTGALLTENTLNVGIDDSIQDFLVRLRITPTASLFDKPFTIGLGQINQRAVREVEATVAKIEGRSERPIGQTMRELLRPKEAIIYAAGILRHAQDTYKKNGFDISEDVPVLASLYNMGKPEKRVLGTIERKENPKPNYYGFFVQEHEDVIKDILKFTPKSFFEISQEVQLVLNKPLRAVAYLDQCRNYESASEVQRKWSMSLTGQNLRHSSKDRSPGKGEIRGIYRVLSAGLDCDMKEWTLIETNDQIGWVPKSELDENTSKAGFIGSPCQDRTRFCVDKLKKVIGASEVSVEEKTGLVVIRPARRQPGGAVIDDEGCLPGQEIKIRSQQTSVNAQVPVPVQGLTSEEVDSLVKKYDVLMKKLKKRHGQDAVTLIEHLGSMRVFKDLEDCKKIECIFNYQETDKTLEKLDKLAMEPLSKIVSQMNDSGFIGYGTTGPSSIKAPFVSEFKTNLSARMAACKNLNSQIGTSFNQIQKCIDRTTKDENFNLKGYAALSSLAEICSSWIEGQETLPADLCPKCRLTSGYFIRMDKKATLAAFKNSTDAQAVVNHVLSPACPELFNGDSNLYSLIPTANVIDSGTTYTPSSVMITFNSQSPTGAFYGDNTNQKPECPTDADETVARLKKISEDRCVENLQINDLRLIKPLLESSSKVVFRENDEKALRIGVRVRGYCPASLPQGPPSGKSSGEKGVVQ